MWYKWFPVLYKAPCIPSYIIFNVMRRFEMETLVLFVSCCYLMRNNVVDNDESN